MPSAAASIRQLVQSYKYAYPSARARALKSFLLTDRQVDDILEAKDLSDAVGTLSNSLYAPVFEGKNDILEIEAALRRHLAEALVKVASFLPRGARTVLREYLGRLEAENIKSVLVGIYAKLPPNEILQRIVPLHINLPEGVYEKMAASKTIEEAISRLEGTFYHLSLSEAYKEYEKSGLLLHLEMALDLTVYERTFAAIAAFGGPDIGFLEKMIGIEVDMKNIKAILRLKHEHVKPEDIVNYLIPHGYRLSAGTLEELCQAVDIEEIITRLERSYYHEPLFLAHRAFEKTKKDKRLNMLEKALDDFQEELGRSFQMEYPLGIGPVLGYVIAKTKEVRRLIAVLKLKDEGFSKSEIEEVVEAGYVS